MVTQETIRKLESLNSTHSKQIAKYIEALYELEQLRRENADSKKNQKRKISGAGS